jgi:hypothetical protein
MIPETRAGANSRLWEVTCRCGWRGTVNLDIGRIEDWLMSRLTCPGGTHAPKTAGQGLRVEIWLGEDEGESRRSVGRESTTFLARLRDRARSLIAYLGIILGLAIFYWLVSGLLGRR